MKRQGTRNGSSKENDSMMRVLQGMMESQQMQMELMRQGLLVVPRE